MDIIQDPFLSQPTPAAGDDEKEEEDNNIDINDISEAPNTGGASSLRAELPPAPDDSILG